MSKWISKKDKSGKVRHIPIKNDQISEIKQDFHKRFSKMSDIEVEKYDAEWNRIKDTILDFYGGYHPKGKNADKKKEAYADFLYMYFILHPNHQWDEREDQPIFYAAKKYAEASTN